LRRTAAGRFIARTAKEVHGGIGINDELGGTPGSSASASTARLYRSPAQVRRRTAAPGRGVTTRR